MILKLLKKLGAFLYETTQTIVIFLSVFVFIYFFAMQPHQVQGDSMLPNFFSGEYILTDKITFRFEEPKRGDVIVFKAPNNPRKDYIKRVIALPGETISVRDDKVYINGKQLAENYLDPNEPVTPGAYLKSGEAVELEASQYFVLGDNRDQSQDSRTWGPIPQEKIIGRVFFRYWPVNAIGRVEAVKYEEN